MVDPTLSLGRDTGCQATLVHGGTHIGERHAAKLCNRTRGGDGSCKRLSGCGADFGITSDVETRQTAFAVTYLWSDGPSFNQADACCSQVCAEERAHELCQACRAVGAD